MLLNRGLLCRVWTFVSLKFHHWVSSTLRYLISHPGLSLAGIPPRNLSRLAAKPNDRLIIYLCAYEGWTRCAASREEALTLVWGGGEALPIKEVRRDNFRICSRAPDTDVERCNLSLSTDFFKLDLTPFDRQPMRRIRESNKHLVS